MRERFVKWWHAQFDDWFFRSMIGPAQTKGAIHGADQSAREAWKRDLERRKAYSAARRNR